MRHQTKVFGAKIPISVVGILLLLSIPSQVSAQSSIGIMAGFTGGTISGSYIESSDGLELGFSGSLLVDTKIGSRFTLMAGAGWIQKGGKKLKLADNNETTYGYQSSYIQIPIYFKAAFPISRKWSIAPFSGVFFAFHGGTNWKEGEQFTFNNNVDENSPGGKVKNLELGIPIGIDFWIEFEGGSRLILEARYDIGLTNIFEAAAALNNTARNSVLIGMFGFTIPLQ